MNLNCGKCGQPYIVPDSSLDDKAVFFHCEKCGHKIVIKTVKEGWYNYQPFKKPPFTISDLPSAIFHSFSIKGVLVPFISLSVLTVFLTLIFFLFYKNIDFFFSRPLFSALFLFTVSSAAAFVYDFTLYLCSLNAFHRLNNNADILFSVKMNQIASDTGKILFFSLAGSFTLLVLSLPVYALKSGGPLYVALFLPLFLIAALLTSVVYFWGGIIFSFIAFNTRTLRQTFGALFKMTAVEHINLIIYTIIINALNAVLFCAAGFLLLSSVLITVSGVLIFFNPEGVPFISVLLPMAGLSGELPGDPSLMSTVKESIEPALFVSSLFITITGLIFAAWIINLRQTLFSAMIKIFDSNPGRSVPGWVTGIAALIILAAAAGVAGYLI